MKRYIQFALGVAFLALIGIWVMIFIGKVTVLPEPVTTTGVSQNTTSTENSSGVAVPVAIMDASSLLNSLRAAGKTVTPINKRALTLLKGKGQVITVDGIEVQIFEYSDLATANDLASEISPDGSTIAFRTISWSSPPHFYKKDKLIVLYVGADPSILNVLRELMGSPFAGS